jgi:hypothetical protein
MSNCLLDCLFESAFFICTNYTFHFLLLYRLVFCPHTTRTMRRLCFCPKFHLFLLLFFSFLAKSISWLFLFAK